MDLIMILSWGFLLYHYLLIQTTMGYCPGGSDPSHIATFYLYKIWISPHPLHAYIRAAQTIISYDKQVFVHFFPTPVGNECHYRSIWPQKV